MKFQGKDGTLRIYDRGLAGYTEVHFRNLDFSAPIGRPKLEELIVLDHGVANEFAHYINTSDMILYDPLPMSFSFFTEDRCALEETRNTIKEALICRYAQDSNLVLDDGTTPTWQGFGGSTKGLTQNNGVLNNPKFDTPEKEYALFSDTVATVTYSSPDTTLTMTSGNPTVQGEYADRIFHFPTRAFAMMAATSDNGGNITFAGVDLTSAPYNVVVTDPFDVYENIRTVDIQFKLTSITGLSIVWKYAEVYFPPQELMMTESEDAVNITASGAIYGTITRHSDWV